MLDCWIEKLVKVELKKEKQQHQLWLTLVVVCALSVHFPVQKISQLKISVLHKRETLLQMLYAFFVMKKFQWKTFKKINRENEKVVKNK